MRKIYDEHDLYGDGQQPPLTISSIYLKIKNSNSSLARQSKRILEDSIERAIDQIRGDEEDASEDSASIDDELDGVNISSSRASQTMNKRVVRVWEQASQQRQQHPEHMQESRVERTTVQKRSSNGEPPVPKRKKIARVVDRTPPKNISLFDLGGVDSIIDQLTQCIGLPMLFPSLYQQVGNKPPRGVLLHGPSGSGKTTIANAYAATLGVALLPISAPSIVSGMSGESEKALREYFEEAKKLAPCLVFLDEIDAISPKRESVQREMERRIVAQLLTCIDDLALNKTNGKPVMIIAATNRPDSLDPALRRGGRLDKEIAMGMPTESERELILKALTRNITLAKGFDFKAIARQTPGFVGADLSDLVSTAGEVAILRFFRALNQNHLSMDVDVTSQATQNVLHYVELSKDPDITVCNVNVTYEDYVNALSRIQPMAKREGFATIPETTWDDIGALETVRTEIWETIIEPIRNPQKYAQFGITAPTATLLWGPPGCGKTLLAKAVAHEANANFMSIKGPELLNKYVGESERAVRQVFERARATVPCIVFIDELDALAPKRDNSLSESSVRVVNTLLMELDGLGKREGIYVLGATNRPDMIDEALLRSGRIETMLLVGLPTEEERVDIAKTLTRNLDLDVENVGIEKIARGCDGFSGADLAKLVRTAGYRAVRRGAEHYEAVDFIQARKATMATVEDIKKYERLELRWGSMRGGGGGDVPNAGNLVASGVADS